MKRLDMAETSTEDTKTKLEVMARFDKEASEFDFERTAAGYRLRHRLIKNLIIREYRPGAVALDMGCGTGEYTLSLAQAGFRVVGGDLSKGMLAVAKSKIQRYKLAQNIQLIRLESTKLPFRDEFFDTITCIALLDWVPDSNKLLVEANRVLKHQAKLIVCTDALWSPYRIYRKVQGAVSRGGKRYARIFNSRELQRAFATSGFVVEKFLGDVLLAQVITRLLYNPKATVFANEVLKATQPLDRRLLNLSLLKSLSAHYIIEARKK